MELVVVVECSEVKSISPGPEPKSPEPNPEPDPEPPSKSVVALGLRLTPDVNGIEVASAEV